MWEACTPVYEPDIEKRWVYTQVYEDGYKKVLMYLDKRKDGNYDVRFVPTHNSVRINKDMLSSFNIDENAKSIAEQLLYEELERFTNMFKEIMEEIKENIK